MSHPLPSSFVLPVSPRPFRLALSKPGRFRWTAPRQAGRKLGLPDQDSWPDFPL